MENEFPLIYMFYLTLTSDRVYPNHWLCFHSYLEREIMQYVHIVNLKDMQFIFVKL